MIADAIDTDCEHDHAEERRRGEGEALLPHVPARCPQRPLPSRHTHLAEHRTRDARRAEAPARPLARAALAALTHHDNTTTPSHASTIKHTIQCDMEHGARGRRHPSLCDEPPPALLIVSKRLRPQLSQRAEEEEEELTAPAAMHAHTQESESAEQEEEEEEEKEEEEEEGAIDEMDEATGERVAAESETTELRVGMHVMHETLGGPVAMGLALSPALSRLKTPLHSMP